MEVWAAIDLSDGCVVRLRQGRWNEKIVYTDKPILMARRWAAEGAHGLHIVDLDAACLGEPRNRRLIGKIIEISTIPVQVGGGLRTWEDIEEVRALGADRLVLGTRAVSDETFLKEAVEALGESLVVAVDARDGQVAVRGWQETTGRNAFEFAQYLETMGVPRILFTDIRTDGTLGGPNLPALRKMAQTVNLPVLASGGISSLEHVQALRELEPLGVEGFIIGRALYEETVCLRDVVRWAERGTA